MASPQESITTVNGRRCTRSRARTAATSIFTTTTAEPAVVTPTEVTTSTIAAQVSQAQTSAVDVPPPPPQSPSSSSPAAIPSSSAPADQPAAAPTSTQAAVPSAIGTISAVPIPLSPTVPLVILAPSEQAVAGPKRPVENSQPVAAAAIPSPAPVADVAVSSQVPVVNSDVPAIPTPTSSDAIPTAALPPSPNLSSSPALLASSPAATASAILLSSVGTDPGQPSRIDTPLEATSVNTPLAAKPQAPTRAPSSPTGDAAAGIIGPDPADSDPGGGGLTIPISGDANIGGIVGGVVGGVAGLALICALLFFCLRKRNPRRPRWAEKNVEGPRFVQKVKAMPAGVGALFAKMKGMKKEPAKNPYPYQRHAHQDSVSSVYSTNEPQSFFAAGDPRRRSSSRKSERNKLRKKSSSVSSQSAFAGIMEERERNAFDPFADPETPRILRLSNPDASPRGPLTPQPAMTSAYSTADPFASPYDNPQITQGVLPPTLGHQRTHSSASALSSHPPTFVFPQPDNTMAKASIGPSPIRRVPVPDQKRRSSMALPTFDATSTAASGNSDYSYFGEPGPSRPGTRLFTPGLPTGRTVRQSDPFDLDRPEVLGFGDVLGRKEVRGSVTRQPSRGKRASTVGNWGGPSDGPFSSWNSAPRK
jgi:hypothetical protein